MIVEELEDASNMPDYYQWKLIMENREKINELVKAINELNKLSSEAQKFINLNRPY